ncbi:MAG: hypothetical protein OWP43_00780 [Sphaerochaetaceae bacterium]|nr:hypothetical protein [Sphaerochaetaceae bacterium]
MHEGCSGSFENGKEVLYKVRMMGYSNAFLPMPLPIECECGNKFHMETFEDHCDKCQMIYAVTPCHAFDPANVMKAGKENA